MTGARRFQKGDSMDFLPEGEALHRVTRLQTWMLEMSVDAVFVFQNADLYYFSGTIQRGLLFIPCEGKPTYFVNKSMTRALQESAWKRIHAISRLEDVPGILGSECMARLERVGIETDVLPASYYLRIGKILPEVELVDASESIRRIRMIKSPYEVGQMRNAARMLIQAWQQLPGWIRPGTTELEVLARMEQFLRLQGHQGIQRTRGFNYEVGYGAFSAGANACFPTSFQGSTGFKGLYPAISNTGSEYRLMPGEPLLVDVAGGYGGYLADAARTYAIGDLPPDMRRAHDLVLELNCEIESMLKPGANCSGICNHAFRKVEASPWADMFMGVGDNHLRFIGHGVGLELDELPVLTPKCSETLQPGMTLSIEPKIFFPGRGGVGIENMYLITETGFEKLTPFREDIICVDAVP
jgi:Xaa-Pro dipeptidase